MILMPRWIALTVFVLICASILALGFYGYKVVGAASEQSAAEIELQRQQFLYISFVAVFVVVVVLVGFVGRTRHISREMDKMIEMNKHGDFSPELSMKKLGSLGKKITLLYFRLNALNEKKSLKITGLSSLVEFLVANTDLSMFITNVGGKVVHVSRPYCDKFEVTRSELLNRDVQEQVSEMEFQQIVTELDRTNTSLNRKIGERDVSLFPVNNRMNELAYIVWLFDRPRVVAEVSRRAETQVRSSRVPDLLRRMFTRPRNSVPDGE